VLILLKLGAIWCLVAVRVGAAGIGSVSATCVVWDVYVICTPDSDLHYFNIIINSLMIILFLTGAIGTNMIRTLHNEIDLLDDGTKESRWKLVHGTVSLAPLCSQPS
jgi:hypothetical protein